MDPFDLPHDCEKEAVTLALLKLDKRQRRVLRAYVRQVECGDKTLAEWIADGPNSVALSTWRQPASKGGKYWGTEADPVALFHEAAKIYKTALLAWQTEEETNALHKASRELKLMAPRAVERLGKLMDYADKDAVRLRAALGVLDRAGIETAAKGPEAVSIQIAYADSDIDDSETTSGTNDSDS